MTILAIDPGPTQSAWVLYEHGNVVDCATVENMSLLTLISCGSFGRDVDHIVAEKVESFGMAVGASVFETVFWTGRFIEAWHGIEPTRHRIGRRNVKLHLCGSARAKDANIRQALIDRFGGSKEAAIGLKKTPGPLYGVKGHQWAALAVAVTWMEDHEYNCVTERKYGLNNGN